MTKIYPRVYYVYYLFVSLLILSCQIEKIEDNSERADQVFKVAKDFFETYAERTDWEKFCSFYREDLVFEDITLQLKLDSLWQLKKFYKWDEEGENFKKLSADQKHLNLYSLVVDDSTAVARGRVNPFYYYGDLIDIEWGMEFTFWLYFDEELKIKKQIDWIEYDPDVLEGVIKWYREQGIDQLPEWLNI